MNENSPQPLTQPSAQPSAQTLPLLGAAMPVRVLREMRDWIGENNRDLELQDFIRADVLNSGDWKPAAAEAKELLADYTGRLGIHGPFWGFSIATEDPDVREVVRKRMQQGLDVCEELGATQMVVHSPVTTWGHNNIDAYPTGRPDLLGRVHDSLDAAVTRAEAIGVELVIENIEDKDPAHRVDLVKSFDSKSVRVSIDTGHAHYAHGSTGAPPVDRYVTAAGELLAHIHLQDADGFADRHWAPGDGTIRWPSIFKAVASLNATPRLILELRDHSEILKGAQHLIDLGLAR
ncbi:MAG: sugar phosphate isomerase/epimerase [Thalassobaculaceae bacterium]|nr:sugar phosphate isomerase/epimerase [Thalassobaculaceae bacterium]